MSDVLANAKITATAVVITNADNGAEEQEDNQ